MKLYVVINKSGVVGDATMITADKSVAKEAYDNYCTNPGWIHLLEIEDGVEFGQDTNGFWGCKVLLGTYRDPEDWQTMSNYRGKEITVNKTITIVGSDEGEDF